MPNSSSTSQQRTHAQLHTRSMEETRTLGERLGRLCRPGDVVLLEGDLGAGKTVLAQGIARGLGVAGIVNSPTFTLVKEYAGRLPLYHFDLYRLEDATEAADLGIDDYLDGEGVCVVEWAERAAALWPSDNLLIRLTVTGPDQRELDLEGSGQRGAALCAQLVDSAAASQQTLPGADGAC